MSEAKSEKRFAMSRRKRNIIFAGLVVTAIFFVWLDRSHIIRTPRAPAGDIQKYHGKRFTVVEVIDGDTIDIDIPDGKYDDTRIRLWGIDAPEKGCYYADEAGSFARELTLDKKVTVYLDEGNRTRGHYGRLLAYIQLPDERYLNEVLISEGYVYADLRFNHSFYNKYKQLQSRAHSQQKGLWKDVGREQLPEWLQRKRPDLLVEQ